MKIWSPLVAASLLCLPVAAMAQPVDGLYVGAGFGYNFMQDQKVKTPLHGHLEENGGPIGVGSVGYGLGNGFRVELQGDYRTAVQSSHGLNDVRNQTYGAFVNALYDFDVGLDYMYPYAGAGVGWEETFETSGLRGHESSLAGQGIVGAAFPIPTVAGLSVTAEYRFMATVDDEKFSGVKIGSQFNHAGLLGLRYAFDTEVAAAPAPPPPPAPAPVAAPTPAPARTYLVFFDWDKSDLSARARQIIGEAAQNASKVKVTRIEVSGYADLTGTHPYNVALSQRRANAVEAELVADGVPKGEIETHAFGDTNPLVPTAEGVREPQNRRVEIVLK
jgi:outer membrane protein OmpA-like peptidoglycan-associated protein